MTFLQNIGRSLMLPIAVLPVAAILLRLGALDAGSMEFLKSILAVLLKAGGSIFDNLPLIFAVGVAIGMSKDQHGAAALAGLVGYLVFKETLPQFHFFDLNGTDGKPMVLNPGVLGGIIVGLICGFIYNYARHWSVPQWLAFFGGRRLVPILSGLMAIVLAAIFAFFWPWAQFGLGYLGNWAASHGGIGGFVFGLFNRLLLVFGLHLVLSTFLWFQVGDFVNQAGDMVHGDLSRFFAGDPTAGVFMTGFFPIMMFGLPAAALAMYLNAKPENRAATGGMLFSLAFTAFLTGITEPIEYTFMFLAPALYGIHAVLTGLSLWASNTIMSMHLGFGFSAGLFDYLLNFNLATNPLRLFIIGPIFFAIYFVIFYFSIRFFNLKTPGREDAVATTQNESSSKASGAEKTKETAEFYLAALGGKENIVAINNCITRLRLELKDKSLIDEEKIKAHQETKGVVHVGSVSYQIIIGTKVEAIADAMRAL